MVPTNPDSRREQAWVLRFMSHFNTCYWRHTAQAIKSQQRIIRWAIAGIGLLGSVLLLIFTQEWTKSLSAAIISFLVSILSTLTSKSDLDDARRGVERWAELASDADSLWQAGEPASWKGTPIAETLQRLLERERHFQAGESHVPKDERRVACYHVVCRELHVQPIEVCHVEAKTSSETDAHARAESPAT